MLRTLRLKKETDMHKPSPLIQAVVVAIIFHRRQSTKPAHENDLNNQD